MQILYIQISKVRIYFNNLLRFPNSLTVSWDAPAIMVTNQKYKMYIQVEKLLQYSTVQRGKPE